jgi:predicted TIM-barrel fold metal-dependent hydrolase/L-rhamnose mutarotase
MRIVDTHLHLVYLDKFSYPWLDGVPAIKKQWTVESYFAEADQLGIETALHMEVDVAEEQMEDETHFVLDGLSPKIGGAIAAVRPEHIDFPRHIERIAAWPGVKGVRRILHTQPDDLSRGELFAANLRRLPQYGLNFELCVRPDQLGIAGELVLKCPDVQFVLNHSGNPPIAGGDLSAWRRDLGALAALPNVAGKVSGIVIHAPPNWTAETLRPVVEHMVQSFGWDRLIWGSDHPVVTLAGSLTTWVQATKALISGASVTEQEKLLFRNAERLYRLQPAAPKRYGAVLGLKPEQVTEYKRVHTAVWPKVLEQIKNSNIRNYSIYLREPENLLFAYYEYTGDNHDADMAAMAADPVTQDWWKICMPMQQPLPTKGDTEWWASMEEVFHID